MYDITDYIIDNLIDFKTIFYKLLERENIKINKNYQFVYDNMLDHLISDTIMYSTKNYNSNKNNDIKLYMFEIFKYQYMNHRHNLYNIEKNPEYIKQLRINKLKKINNYGM